MTQTKAAHIVSFGKKDLNLQITLDAKTIGSRHQTFETHISKGDIVLLHCAGKIQAIATVSSKYFFSNEVLWQDRQYPHRFLIENIVVLTPPVDLLDIGFNNIMKSLAGKGWAFSYIFAPKTLPEESVEFLKKYIPLP